MPADPAALQALAARLEAATEGGRELDAAVWTALGLGEAQWPTPFAFDGETWGYAENGRWQRVPLVSASLDAAVALCEGPWEWSITHQRRRYGSGAYAKLWQSDEDGFTAGPFEAWAPPQSPALALCKARVKAELAACTPSSP